jgi:hypothetical protein
VDPLSGVWRGNAWKRRFRSHDPVGAVWRAGWRIFQAAADQFEKRCDAYAAVEKLNHFLEGESGAFAGGGQLPNCPYQ